MSTEPRTRACPYCAEPILVAARKCKHCGEMLHTAHAGPARQGASQAQIAAASVGVVTVLIGLFVLGWLKPTVYDAAAVQRCVDDASSEGLPPALAPSTCLVPANERRVMLSFGDLSSSGGT